MKHDPEAAREFVYRYLERTKEDPELFRAWSRLGMKVGVQLEDLDLGFTLDCTSGNDVLVSHGYPEEAPGVGLRLSSDLFHQLFTGRANVAMAFAKRQIKATGNVASILKLVGLMPRNIKVYKEFLRERGFEA